MAKFRKQIVKPGRYSASHPAGGNEKVEAAVPTTRLAKWVDNATKMIAAGIKIPAPWKHDPKAVPGSSSKDNAGFWDKFWQDDNDGSIWGIVDVPLAADAEKVGNTVKETSVLVKPTFTDGTGKQWDESMLHVALVTHPIEAGQENFEPIDSKHPDEIAIAMSSFISPDDSFQMAESVETRTDTSVPSENVSNSASGATVKQALEALAKIGLKLPDDTTNENLIERIVIASTALSENNEEENLDNPPPGANEQPSPVAMSHEMSKTDPLLVFASKQAVQSYKSRVTALLESGKVTPAYVKKTLNPLLEGFQLSFNDAGEPNATNLDVVLEALEAQPGNALIGPAKTDPKGKTPKATNKGLSMSLTEEELTPTELGNVEILEGDELDKLVQQQTASAGRQTVLSRR